MPKLCFYQAEKPKITSILGFFLQIAIPDARSPAGFCRNAARRIVPVCGEETRDRHDDTEDVDFKKKTTNRIIGVEKSDTGDNLSENT